MISGSITGLVGTGLVLTDGVEDLPVAANGTFTFPTTIPEGSYVVTVKTQPTSPSQACAVGHGSGTATSAVSDVTVTCMTGAFTVGGTVTGLSGSGLVLADNGANDLAISANGAFTFAMPMLSGAPFAVTVKTQPSGPSQTCTVSGATGTVGAGNVTTVVVGCAVDRFTVGGTISGLAGTAVLQNNGGDNISVTANGSFAFPTTVLSGAAYAVTVLTQPGAPSQTCNVANGTGSVTSSNVTTAVVTCTTNSFTVGGNVVGLAGTGLVLQDNGGDNRTITANGTFTFATPVRSGMTYTVSVLAQPSSVTQSCVVTNGAGTVGAAPVTNVTVTCTTRTFTIGGNVSGLVGTGLVIHNGAEDLAVSASGAYTFVTPVLSGAIYAVTVKTQPSGSTCGVANSSGTVGGANVTNVSVVCAVVGAGDGTVTDVLGATTAVKFAPCGDGTVTNCTQAVAQTSCTAIGRKLVSHASDGTSSVVSLGASASCHWSISYYTNNSPAVAGQCLIGVSNASWTSCCMLTMWHGNIVTIPTTLGQQFGYTYNGGDSGYNAGLSNVSGTTWGCSNVTTPPPTRAGCTVYNVACE